VVREDGDQFHHEICCVPECSAAEGFVNQVNCNALMLLCNFHVDSLHKLVLGLGRGKGHGGNAAGSRNGGLGGFIAIPYILELEAKGDGRAIQVETMQDTLQNLSEVQKISVFMRVEQPSNC